MKSVAKSKTMIFSTVLAVLGIIEQNLGMFQHVIGPQWYGISLIAIGAVTATLRLLTKEPIKLKAGQEDEDEHTRL